MTLIVSTRTQEQHLLFVGRGRWEYNDALALAYQVKAGCQRTGVNRVLIDLREVMASPDVHGRFLICDRLSRVLPAQARVALLAPVELVDVQESGVPGAPNVVLFTLERTALLWLDEAKDPEDIKNPPVLRSEGQVAGKET